MKSPFSTPVRIARLNWVSKTAEEAVAVLLLAKMYFLIAGRLETNDLVKRNRVGMTRFEGVNKANRNLNTYLLPLRSLSCEYNRLVSLWVSLPDMRRYVPRAHDA